MEALPSTLTKSREMGDWHMMMSILRSRLLELVGGWKSVMEALTQHHGLCSKHGDRNGHLTAVMIESFNGLRCVHLLCASLLPLHSALHVKGPSLIV